MMLLVLACMGPAKESSSTESVAEDPTLSGDIQPIFNLNCVTCHSGDAPSGALSLVEGEAMVHLQTVSDQVPTMVRLEPGSLESSYLDYKLRGTHQQVGGIGTAMPPQLPLLESDLALVEAWISSGARP